MSLVENQELCILDEPMPWIQPQHSREDVDTAGRILASAFVPSEDLDGALSIINNWRASHHFPLNTFRTNLRRKAAVFPDAVIAQRVKRLRAIQHKLRKHTKNPIALSEMQDIGGCRAVVKNPAQVAKLHKAFLESDIKHTLVRQDDYITRPKFSGYRGIHLVYAYESDRKETYNGLQIEIQIRTQLQHAWATAVEIVGFFRRELLKSSEGDHIWKHFFKLMAAEICFEEKTGLGIPDIPNDRDQLRDQIRRCTAKLDAINYLGTIGKGVAELIEVETKDAHYFLMELDTNKKQLRITGFKLNAGPKATMDYAEVERVVFGSEEHDAVLVSAESMADLRRAYINYFLDMQSFIKLVETATA